MQTDKSSANASARSAGVALEEYELIITPQCHVTFIDSQDADSDVITHADNRTTLLLRCYGINTACLQLRRRQDAQADTGRDSAARIYVRVVCNQILQEYAEMACIISEKQK